MVSTRTFEVKAAVVSSMQYPATLYLNIFKIYIALSKSNFYENEK
jgi:hypothetical protein